MAKNFPAFVKETKSDLTRLDEVAPTTQEDENARQTHNLLEWQKSFDSVKTPAQKDILLNELKTNAGVDFPHNAKSLVNTGDDTGMTFHILGRGKDEAPAEPDGMTFHILGRRSPSNEADAAPQPPMFKQGEVSENPSGAVTGRAQVPPTRNDIRGSGSPDQGAAFRLGTETGGSFLGGSLGALAGGATGTLIRPGVGTSTGAAVGLRAGETAGAFLGSLVGEAFDPTPHPLEEAAKTAGITLGTGLLSEGGGSIFRKLIGKPHEGGQALLGLMQAKGQVPLPGAVLESEFVRNAQSFGSAAFGTSELLKNAQARMEGVTSQAVREYVSGFQRYHDSAKNLFADIDTALSTPLPTQTTAMVGNSLSGAASTPVTAPGARFFLKGDERARDAVLDVAQNWVNRSGRADAMPTGLQKMYQWSKDNVVPKFTFEETQQVYDALYNKARALDRAAKNQDVTEIAGTNTAAYVREQAKRVKNAFDDQLDNAINSKMIDPDTKAKLVAARANWGMWVQGQELERMVASATKDIEGNGPVKGSKLLNEMDKLAKDDAKIGGKPTLDKGVRENLRRYALAAQAVETSGKQGAFSLVGRIGQMAGIGGMMAGGTVAGGAGGLAFIGPHILAATFANQKASALLIRGLRVEPGTAAALRISRELFSVWEKEGLVGPNYDEGPQEPVGGHPSKAVPE